MTGRRASTDTAASGEVALPAGPRLGFRRRSRPARVGRLVLGAAAVLFVALAVVDRWSAVRGQLAALSALSILGAFGLVIVALVASMLAWRALLADLGSPLAVRPAARVLFLGQLGKYIPGSVWAVVGQTELARDYGVSRKRAVAAAAVFNLLTLALALLVALVGLPVLLGPDVPRWVRGLPMLVPLGLICLVPAVLTRLCNLAFRLARREPLARPFSWRGVLPAVGYLLTMWVVFGLHAAVLAADLGANSGVPPARLLLSVIGAFTGAWAAGFLVLIAPAGAGARELVLTLALAPLLAGGAAAGLTVAVVSRLLMTLGDVTVALLAAAFSARAGTSGRPG